MPNRKGPPVEAPPGDRKPPHEGWLALTVTFSDNLVPQQEACLERAGLIAAWLSLLVAILFGLLSLASSVNVMLRGRREARTIFYANVSFFGLLVATIAFGVLGIARILP